MANINEYIDSIFTSMNENEKKIENLMSSINDYRMANKKYINELVVSLLNEITARDNAMSQLKANESVPDYSGLTPEDIGQTSEVIPQ